MEQVTEMYMMIEIINMVQTFKKAYPDTNTVIASNYGRHWIFCGEIIIINP